MRILFDADQTYQRRAWEAVVDLFEGQIQNQGLFTVARPKDNTEMDNLGIGNKLNIDDEQILENLHNVQLKNGLKKSKSLNHKNFTIEMETGTGKTYVYLRSILELHKNYGFSKFLIVVPSVAIREGTKKNLEITKEHFKGLYDNIPYHYFEYDSSKLGAIRSFATFNSLEIMIITIDAFNKATNVMNRNDDKLGGKPIDFIAGTNPIVIIDEPQSVDTTEKSAEAINSLNPLSTFRYSATHRDEYHMIYRLTAIDAYEARLVKQIEVISSEIINDQNHAYIKLLKVDAVKNNAVLELDILQKGKIKRAKKTVKQGTDLEEVTQNPIYSGYIVNEIWYEENKEHIQFNDRDYTAIDLGEKINDGGSDDKIKQLQIAQTIESHLDKKRELYKLGFKVLSLFFLDKVSNYRIYGEDGKIYKGKYAEIFEQEYERIIKLKKYQTLFEQVEHIPVEEVHGGYFSMDKKNQQIKDTRGNTVADSDTYDLIMKDKEKLLSFDSKLEFIFSHSALREGWDNPNVFQICTLNETKSTIKKRQEIGRGLRLAVNQKGERSFDRNINILTVTANESYEEFAATLQKEIEESTNIRFGYVEEHSFANIVVMNINEEPEYLGDEKSIEIYNHLLENKYIASTGKIEQKLKHAIVDKTLILPPSLKNYEEEIIAYIDKASRNIPIRDANDKKEVYLRKAVLLSPKFKELWDQIKQKTTYNVTFESENLIRDCVGIIKESALIPRIKTNETTARLSIEESGVGGEITNINLKTIDSQIDYLPDILSYLQDETGLMRKTIAQLLVQSGKLEEFKYNPQLFMQNMRDIILRCMQSFIVDGISYTKIDEYYQQSLFEENKLIGYFKDNLIQVKKSVYEAVVYDSEVERNITTEFEQQENVKLYVKLPSWFKVDTPLGSYNPDWAVLIEEDETERLYFVVETKSSMNSMDLRNTEYQKIRCGKKHFEAINTQARFIQATKYEDIVELIK